LPSLQAFVKAVEVFVVHLQALQSVKTRKSKLAAEEPSEYLAFTFHFGTHIIDVASFAEVTPAVGFKAGIITSPQR